MPVTAQAKWGKGHDCCVGTLTAENVKDAASQVQYSQFPVWIFPTKSVAIMNNDI